MNRTVARPLSTSEEICSALMGAQAVVGVLLWWAYFSSDTVRSWFELTPDHPQVTDAFFVADLAAIVSSLLAAWAIRGRRPWAALVVAFTTGLIIYPTVYLVAWVASTDDVGVAALVIMIPPAVVNPWVLVRTYRDASTTRSTP